MLVIRNSLIPRGKCRWVRGSNERCGDAMHELKTTTGSNRPCDCRAGASREESTGPTAWIRGVFHFLHFVGFRAGAAVAVKAHRGRCRKACPAGRSVGIDRIEDGDLGRLAPAATAF